MLEALEHEKSVDACAYIIMDRATDQKTPQYEKDSLPKKTETKKGDAKDDAKGGAETAKDDAKGGAETAKDDANSPEEKAAVTRVPLTGHAGAKKGEPSEEEEAKHDAKHDAKHEVEHDTNGKSKEDATEEPKDTPQEAEAVSTATPAPLAPAAAPPIDVDALANDVAQRALQLVQSKLELLEAEQATLKRDAAELIEQVVATAHENATHHVVGLFNNMQEELHAGMCARAEALGRVSAATAAHAAVKPLEFQVDKIHEKMTSLICSLERSVHNVRTSVCPRSPMMPQRNVSTLSPLEMSKLLKTAEGSAHCDMSSGVPRLYSKPLQEEVAEAAEAPAAEMPVV